MSITIIGIAAASSFVASLAAGFWLVLHLNSLASAFESKADLVASDTRARHSKQEVLVAIAVLLGGAALCIALAMGVIVA
ncbi:hypothetical protein AB433_09110 [Croceicoccus naphthovorans]|uniref:Uncharacterized protein n=2 Tax=Croceicoccus naphthovorans TaxID=1348774 RepID=A0A0G3XF07_9SPHN|nr:hypothetical protein AB433_09110 [Croceicoccus naphthovorans]